MKVVVIGAGILGASTAYHLAREGCEVVLVDRADEGRATVAGAGAVNPDLADGKKDQVFTAHPFIQTFIDEFKGRRHLKPAFAVNKSAGQISRAHSGGISAQRPVSTGMRIRADYQVSRAEQSLSPAKAHAQSPCTRLQNNS